jgi:hypothetical protein
MDKTAQTRIAKQNTEMAQRIRMRYNKNNKLGAERAE